MILQKLQASIEGFCRAWAKTQDFETPVVVLTAPPEHVAADIALSWPLAAAKRIKRDPMEVARELAERLGELPELEVVESLPPGFLNIRLKAQALSQNLNALLDSPEHYGKSSSGQKRNILLEFVSANPTGPLHLASGRAATLGDALTRILRRRGHNIHSEYYVNDVGRQVELLGLSVQARFYELKGRPAQMPEDGYHGEYIREIAQAAPAQAEHWPPSQFSHFAVQMMLKSHQEDMKAFGVSFDKWFLESELHSTKALDRVLNVLMGLGRIHEKDGAVWLGRAEEGGEDKDRVLIRSDGRPTYFLADIAYHQNKLERGYTELINIWGADHHGYIPRMKAAIEALGRPPETFHAIIHQLVHLFRGQEKVKMSKRAGEFITLRELVAEAGLDACRFFFALRSANSHLNFDLELARKQSSENPVYYVQYVHARIASVFREAAGRSLSPTSSEPTLAMLQKPSERALMVKIMWFPEILLVCERELSPHPLANYLLELAALFHPFYETCRVLDDSDQELSAARLRLCAGVQAVIAQGLGLLGVSTPERM